MAKNNNLTDFLTDVANAIREKDGSTGTINPQDFSSKIKAISTGVDTSDGNIEPTTVLKGYKGYAKGVAVNGAIETYDGSFDNLPVVDVVKGDLITIENKQYRVLKVSGTVAEVIGMYIASSSQLFNTTGASVVFTGGKRGIKYQGSKLDTYLNETFFNTLSETMRKAIVPKTINQDMWSYSNTAPSSGTYYHQTYNSNNRYYYDSDYGTAEVGSRNVYALSVRDILDYLGVSANGDFTDTDIWQMFWNSSTNASGSLWLRSAFYSNSDMAFYIFGHSGYFDGAFLNNNLYVRPAFQIDLSKIAYTKN